MTETDKQGVRQTETKGNGSVTRFEIFNDLQCTHKYKLHTTNQTLTEGAEWSMFKFIS